MTEAQHTPSLTESNASHAAGAARLIPFLLVGSGFCSLMYQTVWFREFRLIFGSSTPATAAVLSIFMGAIGVGSAVLGRRAERAANGLAYYARLELFIALSAALTPLLTLLVRSIYYATGGSPALGATGGTIVRLLLSVVVLGIPTFLMGGTLPAAVKSFTRSSDTTRRSVATLYAANTFGGVLGTVAATFLFLELLGTRNTLFFAAALNLLVAVVSRSIANRETAPVEAEPLPEGDSHGGASYGRFLLFAAFFTGFTFFFLELVWYRMLAPILGGSTFTFGLILALALLGIGLGGFIYSRAERREATLALFGLTCAVEAAAIVIPYAFGDRLATFAIMLQSLRGLGFDGQIFAWSLIAGIVVLPAATVAGYQFPVIVALAGRGAHKVSSHLGDIYAWNTAGAIVGSLAGGFGLIPLLGATGSWKATGWLMAVLALFAMALAWRRTKQFRLATALIATFTIALPLLSTGPTAAWRHSPIGAGRVHLIGANQNAIREWQQERRRTLHWEMDGKESGVALAAGTGWAFIVNGKSDGDSMGDAGTMVMAGLLPALLQERVERALVIGLGTGGSAGWLAAVPTMKRVDVYELEPAILRVANDCKAVNFDVLNHEKVNVTIGDARELLLTSREPKYDIIFSEPSNPYRSGVASLFTRDYYEAAREHLNKDGRFVQWVQAYEIDAETLHTIYATLHSVFPYVQTWQTYPGDIVLISGSSPLPIDAELIRSRMAAEPYRTALQGAWRAGSVEDVLSFFMGDERFGEAMASSPLASLNTDNRNVIEFGFARTMGMSGVDTDMIRNASAAMGTDKPAVRGVVDRAAIRDAQISSPVVAYKAPEKTAREVSLAAATAAYLQGHYSRIPPFWASLGRPLRPGHETLMAALALAERGDANTTQLLKQVAAFQPVEALVVEARLQAAQAHHREAADALSRAFHLYRREIWADPKFMRFALAAAPLIASRAETAAGVKLFEALENPFPLELLREERREALFRLAEGIEGQQCGPRSMATIMVAEPHVVWSKGVLRRRAHCYALMNHPRAGVAREEYADFVAAEQSPLQPLSPATEVKR